jgi:hypothetical protein
VTITLDVTSGIPVLRDDIVFENVIAGNGVGASITDGDSSRSAAAVFDWCSHDAT